MILIIQSHQCLLIHARSDEFWRLRYCSRSYYEDQKVEALRKAEDFRSARIPKYLDYFERILKSNEGLAKGKYLVGDQLTYADTTVWQVIDG